MPQTLFDKIWDAHTVAETDAGSALIAIDRVFLHERTGDPSLYLYEQIQISDDGKNRCRTWHWIRNGILETRTAIQEVLVTRDWRSIDQELKATA